ncbi:MAG: NAD-binding protein [Nitrospirales bacterium]|nr:NAD-binding protein [Nitrospirales bacterium]
MLALKVYDLMCQIALEPKLVKALGQLNLKGISYLPLEEQMENEGARRDQAILQLAHKAVQTGMSTLEIDENKAQIFLRGTKELGSSPCANLDDVTRGAVDDYLVRLLEENAHKTSPLLEQALGIPNNLPLLDLVGESNMDGAFTNTVLVGVQHLLGSTIPLVKWLNNWGVNYDRMFICGKAYSTHAFIAWKLRELGVHVHPNSGSLSESRFLSEGYSYDTDLRVYITSMLDEAIETLRCLPDEVEAPRRLLVLDDGATCIEALNAAPERWAGLRISAVEQTRRGARLVQSTSKPLTAFPVSNVAESSPKLELESPLIGLSVVAELQTRISRIEGKEAGLDGRQITVIGFGSVGKAVAKYLRDSGAKVAIIDTDPRKLQAAQNERFHCISPSEVSDTTDCLLGCTGFSILGNFPDKNWKMCRYLVSASSSNAEFYGLLGPARGHPQVPAPMLPDSDHQRIHADRWVGTTPGEGPLLLAGGFPINFPGTSDPIPLSDIQLTRALILSGARQAHESETSGLIPFDIKEARWITRAYQELRGEV